MLDVGRRNVGTIPRPWDGPPMGGCQMEAMPSIRAEQHGKNCLAYKTMQSGLL